MKPIMSWNDPKFLFQFGPRAVFSIWRQHTPVWWWFRIVSFQSGPDHDRRNGWHFYVPFLRLTRSAK